MAKKVLVIRVGSKTTHIVHMDNVADDPAIYACLRVTTPEGSVSDGQIMDVTDLARMIVKALKDKHINCKDVVFVIPSSKIASREATLPAVGKQRIGGLVSAKTKDLFPVDQDQYIFSHILQGDPYAGGTSTLPTEDAYDQLMEAESKDKKKKKKKKGETGEAELDNIDEAELVQDVLIFAAPTELIDSYYTLANAIGLRINALEADGNSVFQIMRRQVGRGTSVSVQINRDSTLVNVINQEKLLLQRVIPYGVNVFTDVIMEEPAFRCDTFDKAYKLVSSQRVLLPKLGVENTVDDFSTAKRIEVTNAGDHLIGNIVRVVEFYNAQHSGDPIQSVSLIGWGCSIVGIHDLLTNELGLETNTPTEILGVRFNRKVDIGPSMLQYLNCLGAVFSPVGFKSRTVAEKKEKQGNMIGPVLICGLLVVVAATVSVWSYMSLFNARDEKDAAQQKVNELAYVDAEYNEVMSIERNYTLCKLVKVGTDLNNNHFHKLLTDIEDVVPESVVFYNITSDGDTVTINAGTNERLHSLSALLIQLNKIQNIKNCWIQQIAEDEAEVNKKHKYNYSMTFTFDRSMEFANSLSELLEEYGVAPEEGGVQ